MSVVTLRIKTENGRMAYCSWEVNNSIRSSLGNRAPITVFSGLPADTPLHSLVLPKIEAVKSVSEVEIKKIVQAGQLLTTLDEVQKEVFDRREQSRHAAIKRHNELTGVRIVNFSIGDYVLVAKRHAHQGSKLSVKWCGPQIIVRAESEVIFECQDLINGKIQSVHSNRIKFYANSELNVCEDLLKSIQNNESHYEVVTKIHDLRYNRSSREWKVSVSWRGFDENDWETFSTMIEDIPEMLGKILSVFPDQGKVARAKSPINVAQN